MVREYIKNSKPNPLPFDTAHLKILDDEFWKNWVFYYLLDFYKNYDRVELKSKIEEEKKKEYPRIEREIAKFVRIKLNANKEFGYHFTAIGERTNDELIEGNYDISINNTYWKSKDFYFECKNLDETQDLINKYVFYNTYKKDHSNNYIYDGGVLRFFNGKYAQSLNFGGMIGFVIEGNLSIIKSKILKKLEDKFNISPEGDLKNSIDCSILSNNFTFDSIHNRFNSEFLLHHILLDLK